MEKPQCVSETEYLRSDRLNTTSFFIKIFTIKKKFFKIKKKFKNLKKKFLKKKFKNLKKKLKNLKKKLKKKFFLKLKKKN